MQEVKAKMKKGPIRVLHVVTYMGRGGLETMLMNYYRNIDRTKVQFDFLVHRQEEADYDAEIKSMGGKIYRLPRLNPWSVSYLRVLNKFFKEHPEYQIVHSHLDCMSGIPLKYAKKNGVKVRIAHAHSSSQTKDIKYPLKLLFKKKISNRASHMFACGQEAGDWMFNGAKFRVLNNAIDAQKFIYQPNDARKIKKELGIEDKFVIGHVGRFAPPKNHDFLIDIFNEIQMIEKESVLLLIGHGEYYQKIQEKVKQLGLERKVLFMGLQSNVAEWMQAMDVFVFPSIYEGLPVTMIEAQAAGMPCVISDKVPIECKKTDLVTQLSLELSAKEWAKQILTFRETKKRNTYEQIVRAHFDIKENAKWLQDFYVSLC
jgi:glycosyltransferase involved in cell wall biosynthesis